MAIKPRCNCARDVPRSGFGSLRILPSGRHQARYTGPDGKVYKAPHTFDRHTDADRFLDRVSSEISREVWEPPTRRQAAVAPLTFGEYAPTWLAERRDSKTGLPLKARTRDHYQTILEKFLIPVLGARPLAEITPEEVRAWYARVATGPTYRAHAYSLLRTIMRTAVDDRLIPGPSPCVIRSGGRARRARTIRMASLDELEAIIAATPEQFRLMVLLAAWCQLRFGELAELRRSDVDLGHGVLRIRRGVTWVHGERPPGATRTPRIIVIDTPKSDAGTRDIAIPPHLLPLIKAHLRGFGQWGRDGLLFPSAKGGVLTNGMLNVWWWPARAAAEREDLRFHDLRHTGATLAAQTGATLKELMGRLGHTTPAAALIYQHVASGRDAEIAQALSDIAIKGGLRSQ